MARASQIVLGNRAVSQEIYECANRPGCPAFLLNDDGFPRSVLHCLNRALSLLRHLEETQHSQNGKRAIAVLEPLVEKLKNESRLKNVRSDVHKTLTHIIDSTANVCIAVHDDYFDPPARSAPTNIGSLATRASTEFPRVATQVQEATPHLAPERSSGRQLTVVHETVYTYESPVTHSTHVFRLSPVHDARQRLINFELRTTPPGSQFTFDDVFGNTAVRVDVEGPYQELRIESRSTVSIHPAEEIVARGKTTIPLLWMPWQRQMMLPYLLPMELPESHLRKLYDYAMSFVEEANFDLVETLITINKTIHNEFAYVSGSTTVETTPYEVFQTKRGVCQDFANLFICLAQLLNVPARYRVGYIYTGGDYENKIQSEASHAWAELYLPWLGWRGFDPTNGCLTNQDHVRVAAGRNYRDATPTSGTFYGQATAETLDVAVRITQGGEQ